MIIIIIMFIMIITKYLLIMFILSWLRCITYWSFEAQLKLADTLKKLGEQADKNGLELDLDIAGDMAALKVEMVVIRIGKILMMAVTNWFQKNLAKFKRGKHGAGLDDIDIEELDWVRNKKASDLIGKWIKCTSY